MISEQKKIVITGAGGFLGSHLVRRCIQEGYRVIIFVKPSTDLTRIKDILPQLTSYDVDITDVDRVKTVMQEVRPNGVVHLAASNIKSGVTASDEEVVRVNILGIRNLVTSLAEIDYQFFINTGSFLEYGMKKTALKEEDRCEPTELYSVTKLASTLYGQSVARATGKPIISFRLFTPYGPEIQPGRLIHELVARATRNEEIKLTSPSITRDFVFIDDIIDLYMEGIERAKECKGEIFNLGSGEATALETVVGEVVSITNSKSKVSWGALKNVQYDSDLWQADMAKTFSHFTWRPKHTLKEGLTKTITWFTQGHN